jgi:hypothetical protein
LPWTYWGAPSAALVKRKAVNPQKKGADLFQRPQKVPCRSSASNSLDLGMDIQTFCGLKDRALEEWRKIIEARFNGLK